MNEQHERVGAQRELQKFFALTAKAIDTDEMKMPRGIVDSAWHSLQLDSSEYIRFCAESAGTYVEHVQGSGCTEMLWVTRYEAEYGPLDELWFTDENGELNKAAYDEYVRSGKMIASWDCGPVLPDKGRSIQDEIDNLRKVIDINKKVTDLNDINIPGVDKIQKIDDAAIIDSIKEKIDRFNIEKIREKYKQ